MNVRDGENAVVDIEKLVLYCLDPQHPRGGHKARQFSARLGFCAQDAEALSQKLLDAVRTSDQAVVGEHDQYGQRYQLDVEMTGPDGTAVVRTNWITRTRSNVPRLITCHVL